MAVFLSKEDLNLSNEFENKGYIIKDIKDLELLNSIEKFFSNFVLKRLKIKKNVNSQDLLNKFHNFINIQQLNSFRLDIISFLNDLKDFRKNYYYLAKYYLDSLVGNELVMQNRINLSIQIPKDSSSLLPVHSDVWSGDSPFEVVVWLPLVNCYKTKSMYILPPKKYQKFKKEFKKIASNDSEKIYHHIKKDLDWINIKYGQILIFNQSLPHGNRVNIEKETRWSMNCRFKSIFSPYGDKKIGEFFEPITLRKMSEVGINYELPKIK